MYVEIEHLVTNKALKIKLFKYMNWKFYVSYTFGVLMYY